MWYSKVVKASKELVTNFRHENGFVVMLLPLLLILIGGLVFAPLLGYLSTAVHTERFVYEESMQRYYAADSGIEHALWRIEKQQIPSWMKGTWADTTYTYSPYAYSLPPINNENVAVEIDPVWPLDGLGEECLGSNPPGGMTPQPELVVLGDTKNDSGNGVCQVSISYDESMGSLRVEKIGAWIPDTVSYLPDSSNLGFEPEQYSRRNGTALVWSFGGGGINYADLPGDLNKRVVIFQYSPAHNIVEFFSWIRAQQDDTWMSWDADVKVYRMTSEATNPDTGISTTVEAYVTKNEARMLSSTIAGDYTATGNTLMIDKFPDKGGPRRDTLLAESSSTVSSIPSNAIISKAYLYWSGWYDLTIFEDGCDDFDNFDNGGRWSISSSRFRGWSDDDSNPYLTLSSSLDLSLYAGKIVNISWDQSETGDFEDGRLMFNLSADGGSTWSSDIEAFNGNIGSSPQTFSYTIPSQYLTENFKFRFFLEDLDEDDAYCYINRIELRSPTGVADPTCYFAIDGTRVYLDTNGDPQVDVFQTEELTADNSQVINNLDYGNPHGYTYSSKKNVTELVRTFTKVGNATYTVGGVDAHWDRHDEWAYAGWSLVIIYTSPDTLGHRLYLYDTFLYCDHKTNLDFDQDGEPGGTIGGFLVPSQIKGEGNSAEAAKITCFVAEGDDYYNGDYIALNGTKLWDGTEAESRNDVWNNQSIGLSADGVDIDTFKVTWGDKILATGDTQAQIDIYTEIDIWNLVYIIISFRSETAGTGVSIYNIL